MCITAKNIVTVYNEIKVTAAGIKLSTVESRKRYKTLPEAIYYTDSLFFLISLHLLLLNLFTIHSKQTSKQEASMTNIAAHVPLLSCAAKKQTLLAK